MNLRQYRINLGWNVSKLAEESRLARLTVSNAERGGIITAETAKALSDALSKGYGREIQPLDIQGLNVR